MYPQNHSTASGAASMFHMTITIWQLPDHVLEPLMRLPLLEIIIRSTDKYMN